MGTTSVCTARSFSFCYATKTHKTRREFHGVQPHSRSLEAEGFIDELRFATAYVHDKFCFDRWGRLKISYKLTANHQITQTVINKALLQLNAEEELQLLEGLLRGKVKENEPLTEELKMKLLRFSEQRGFTKTQFFAVLRRIKDNIDE